MMRAAVERLGENLVRKKKGAFLSALLTPPSRFYKMGVQWRNWAYDKGLISVKKAEIPVVSIGNIVAGGAGKTSLTALIAKELMGCGKVALVTSGYRSKGRKKEPVVVSVGNGPEISWQEGGDEAWLLSNQLPEAIVIAGRDRFGAAELAWLLGAEIVLLDDGMQHRQLFRDCEIALVDGADPFGGGHFLPKGMLRDEPRRLNAADCVVSVGDSFFPPTGDGKKWVKMRRGAKGICFGDGKKEPSFDGKKVGLFCAIGNPAGFIRLVEEKGARVVATSLLADHRPMEEKRLFKFAREVKERGGELLLCTEKDWVKLSASCRQMKEPLPIGWVELELEIVENRPHWQWTLEQIKNRLV